MALFDFLKKKKALRSPAAQPVQDSPVALENEEGILIGTQCISGPGMHISCTVVYIPSKRVIVGTTRSTGDPAPRQEVLDVPPEVNSADGLIGFIRANRGAWLVFGYRLRDELRQQIDATFREDWKQEKDLRCGEKPVRMATICDNGETKWFCRRCGHANSFGNHFCEQCGAKGFD